jgi:hypothetical protein
MLWPAAEPRLPDPDGADADPDPDAGPHDRGLLPHCLRDTQVQRQRSGPLLPFRSGRKMNLTKPSRIK